MEGDFVRLREVIEQRLVIIFCCIVMNRRYHSRSLSHHFRRLSSGPAAHPVPCAVATPPAQRHVRMGQGDCHHGDHGLMAARVSGAKPCPAAPTERTTELTTPRTKSISRWTSGHRSGFASSASYLRSMASKICAMGVRAKSTPHEGGRIGGNGLGAVKIVRPVLPFLVVQGAHQVVRHSARERVVL